MVDEYEDEDECEMQPVGGVWIIGQIDVQKNRESRQAGNRFTAIAIDDEDEIPVMAVEHVDKTRESLDRVQRRGSEEAFGISREDGHGWKSCCAGIGRLLIGRSEKGWS